MTPGDASLDGQRVLHVVNRLTDRGDGISNVCVDLACQQAVEGDIVAVATTAGGYTDLVRSFGVEVTVVDFRLRSAAGVASAFGDLRRLVHEFDPDVVHAHTVAAALLARLAVLGGRGRVVATVHNEYQRGVFLMAAAHRVVGVSEAVSRAMRRRGVPRRKTRTVLNGTVGSARRGAPTAGPAVDRPGPAIVAVGAVSHRKGADVLVQAGLRLAETHGAHTYLAGNVDWEEPQEAAQRSPWGSHVHFLGFQADPRPLLEAATVFALASRRDPAPLVLVEAMEAGLPIVASAVDGVPELLGRDSGKLVPPDDVAALAEALGELLDDDTERERMSDAARGRCAVLSVPRVTADYRGVYAELTRRRRRPTGQPGNAVRQLGSASE